MSLLPQSEVSQPQEPNPLLERQNFQCRFPYHNHIDKDDIISKGQAYLLERWPFQSEKQKEFYLACNIEDWGTLLAYGAPRDRTEIYVIWETFYVLLDDVLENLPTAEIQNTVSRLSNIISMRAIPEDMNAIESCLDDICRQIRAASSTVDIDGFAELTTQFFKTTCEHIEHSASKKERRESLEHGLGKYLDYRIGDIAGWCSLLGQLWCRGVVLPPHIASDEDCYTLQKISLIHAILINDLISYRKEIRAFEENQRQMTAGGKEGSDDSERYTVYNSLTVFLEHDQMSPSEALDHVKKTISGYEDQFLGLLEKLRNRYAGSAKDLDVVEGLGMAMMDLMKGNAHWSNYTARYHKV